MKLFNDNNEIEKIATLALPTDTTKWSKVIITDFLTMFPVLQQAPINLNWTKQDTTKGFAVGSLTVLGGGIPVVVKDFKMYPLDLIVFPDKVIPLDAISIQELMSSESPFIGAYKGKTKGSLSIFGDSKQQWSPINSLTGGNDGSGTVVRPSEKIASFIDNISSFDYKDLEKIAKLIDGDDELAEIYANSEAFRNPIEKIAGKVKDYDKQWLDLLKTATIDRQYLYTDEHNNHFVKQAFSHIDYVTVTRVNKEDLDTLENIYAPLKKVASTEDVEEFIQYEDIKPGSYGRFIDTYGNSTSNLQILKLEKVAAASEEDYAIFHLATNKSILVSKDGKYLILDKKITNVSNTAQVLDLITDKPSVDDMGIFVVNGIATEPFRIVKIIPDLSKPGSFEIHASRYGQPLVTFKLITTNLPEVINDPNSINTYYVPGNAIFVKLERSLDSVGESDYKDALEAIKNMGLYPGDYKVAALSELEPVEFVISNVDKIEDNRIPFTAYFGQTKTASSINTGAVHIVSKDAAGLYRLFGPEFNKYASLGHKIGDLSADSVAWPLIHLGATSDDLDNVLNLHRGGELKIATSLKAPYSVEEYIPLVKQASEYEDLPELTKLQDFVKIAAKYAPDETSVDAILSLGMVNKFNILEYLNLIPDYERILSEFARLLLFTRVSTTEIDENNLAALVSYLNQVIYELKTLRSIVTSSQKTSRSNGV